MRRTYVARPDDHWQAYCRGWRAGRAYRRKPYSTPTRGQAYDSALMLAYKAYDGAENCGRTTPKDDEADIYGRGFWLGWAGYCHPDEMARRSSA